MKAEIAALYFNGLGDGTQTRREAKALEMLRRAGIAPHHLNIDWRSRESFDRQFERCLERLDKVYAQAGKVMLIGYSAGGSMALNVFADASIDDPSLFMVSIAGRLQVGPTNSSYPWNLHRSAHMGSRRESRLFYESVEICDEETIPVLTDDQVSCLAIFKPAVDLVVPKPLMDVPGVEPMTLNAYSHGAALLAGVREIAQL